MKSKFNIGDKIRVTAEVAKDEDFHSDVEADLLSDRESDDNIARIIGRITGREALTITHVGKHDTYCYSTDPTVGCALAEDQVEPA